MSVFVYKDLEFYFFYNNKSIIGREGDEKNMLFLQATLYIVPTKN